MLADRAAVAEGVRHILNEQLVADPGTAYEGSDHLFDDLGLDSLDAVELLLKADTHFGLDITDEECEGVNTVDQLISMLLRHEITIEMVNNAVEVA